MQNGTLLQKGATKITKQGGLLIYNDSGSTNQDAPIVYNTLSTPRGGQYQVVLSDGSKVWLNAASSLHFPTSFTGNQRVVELTGEAYFEVTKNKKKPFFVKVGDMQVKVLGTHFNINAYSDESSIKTSLLEGSVKIAKGKVTGLLNPGEQAVLDNQNDKVEIKKVNMDEVMAWKNGIFQFDGADLTTIMRDISRWYNVEIVYDGEEPMRRFEGKISRTAQLSDVLKILALSNVKFIVVGNKIIVH
jgi:transmembrane sensor